MLFYTSWGLLINVPRKKKPWQESRRRSNSNVPRENTQAMFDQVYDVIVVGGGHAGAEAAAAAANMGSNTVDHYEPKL